MSYWFDRLIYNIAFRRLCGAGCALLMSAALALEWQIRHVIEIHWSRPTIEVWLSVAYGFMFGVAMMLFEHHHLRTREAELLKFHLSSLKERLTWRRQFDELRRGGCLWLAILPICVRGLARKASIL